MICLNCQCITPDKWNLISVEYVHNERVNAKFVCLTETWFRDGVNDGVSFSGYAKRASFSCSKNLGGGVALWSKECLEVKEIDLKNICVEKHFEICGVEWLVAARRFVNLLCYRSSKVGNIDIFCDGLSEVLHRLYRSGSRLIITGDFNTDPIRDSRHLRGSWTSSVHTI